MAASRENQDAICADPNVLPALCELLQGGPHSQVAFTAASAIATS